MNGTEAVKGMVKFTVQIGKNEATLKHLSLPSNSTLLIMRQLINKEFNLGNPDYELFF